MNVEDVRQTAYVLFVEKGIKATTMDSLSKELGVSKKTLYKLIDSKDSLIQTFVDRFLIQFVDLTYKASTSEKLENSLINLTQTIISVRKENRLFIEDLKTYYPEIWNEAHDIMSDIILNVLDLILENSRRKIKTENSMHVAFENCYSYYIDHLDIETCQINDNYKQILKLLSYGLVEEQQLN